MSNRRPTKLVSVGGVPIGGGNPIVVQSMTDTDTADIDATVSQVKLLSDAGSELVRVTVNNDAAAAAVPRIRERLDDIGCHVPIIGDFHFIGHRLLSNQPDCARTLAKFRINPGNVGRGLRHDDNFRTFIEIARDLDKPVRIGVNAGSLDPDLLAKKMDENSRRSDPVSGDAVEREALVESAISSAEAAGDLGLPEDHIIISCKVSRLNQMVEAYREISRKCDFPLHLGLTEAGMGTKGIVTTTSALSILLYEGIGDTIRSSLTPEPGGDRSREVRLCQEVLQALNLRSFRPAVTACPGCGRTTSTLFRELARDIQQAPGRQDARRGSPATPAPRPSRSPSWAAWSMARESPASPISAYPFQAPARLPAPPSSSTENAASSSKVPPSPTISSKWSKTTSKPAGAARPLN